MTDIILKRAQIELGDKGTTQAEFKAATAEEFKAIEDTFKAAGEDVPVGYIAGWASTPDLDLVRDIVVAGAFDESIKERGFKGPKGIKLLLNHKRDSPAGRITVLETRQKKLWIEAQLNLGISYVNDAYLAAKDVDGFSFSVGFRLQDFEFKEVDDGNEALFIKRADLFEVSMVPFPANPEAGMSFIKSTDNIAARADDKLKVETVAQFEKALVADGFAASRREANKLQRLIKANIGLFGPAPVAAPEKKESPLTAEKVAALRKSMTDFSETIKKLAT